MKQSRLLAAIFVLGCLYACSSQASTASQPAIAYGALDTAEAYLKRGDSFSTTKDYDHAITAYNEAIRMQPDYAEAYNNRGYAWYWKGEAALAIADYSQAIALRPNYAYAYNNRGAAYMASGHPDKAISDFDRAIQLQPDYPQAYTNRGNAYLRKGRIDLAIADFRHAGKNPTGLIAIICSVGGIIFLGGAVVTYRFARRNRLAKR